jgi:hypothetical protein
VVSPTADRRRDAWLCPDSRPPPERAVAASCRAPVPGRRRPVKPKKVRRTRTREYEAPGTLRPLGERMVGSAMATVMPRPGGRLPTGVNPRSSRRTSRVSRSSAASAAVRRPWRRSANRASTPARPDERPARRGLRQPGHDGSQLRRAAVAVSPIQVRRFTRRQAICWAVPPDLAGFIYTADGLHAGAARPPFGHR